MTITLSETTNPTTSSASVDFSARTQDPQTRAENSEFGQVMSGLMRSYADASVPTAGQEVAAQSVLQPVLPPSFGRYSAVSLGGAFLKAVHLGPTMNVITSAANAPDAQSLEAFARSQGLDETAVQWLMCSTPALAPTTPVAPPMTSMAIPVLQTQPSGLQSGPFNDNTRAGESGAALLADGFNTAALWAMAQTTDKAPQTSPAPEDAAEVANVQINLMASNAPAAIWMLRHPLAAAPSKEATTTQAGISLSEIDLTQAAPPELLESLNQALAEAAPLSTAPTASEQPTPLSGHLAPHVGLASGARQDPPSTNVSGLAPDSGHAQRSENAQNLAEKMGQAVGQRILSEIEKGQWHLKLLLRPATLGHIEVEMRMRSGELDAVFTAPQAVTRELLQEGMSKLKDTLNQMGMDVASMQVGDGQTSPHGGDSTPKQMSKSTKTKSNDPKSSLSAAQTPAPRKKLGQDGWDVLV